MPLVRAVLTAAVLMAVYVLVVVSVNVPYGWVLPAVIAANAMRRRTARLTSHGQARWADASDLRGMIDE